MLFCGKRGEIIPYHCIKWAEVRWAESLPATAWGRNLHLQSVQSWWTAWQFEAPSLTVETRRNCFTLIDSSFTIYVVIGVFVWDLKSVHLSNTHNEVSHVNFLISQILKFGKGERKLLLLKSDSLSGYLASWKAQPPPAEAQRQGLQRRRDWVRSFMLNKLSKYTYSVGYRRSYECSWRWSWCMHIKQACYMWPMFISQGRLGI